MIKPFVDRQSANSAKKRDSDVTFAQLEISDIEKASMMAINVISDQHKNINDVFFFEKCHATKPQQRNSKYNF